MQTSLVQKSKFEYKSELNGLKKTYGNCLSTVEESIQNKESFLEIGCGNGFVLELAKNNGWHNIVGVEPSSESIENSDPVIKAKILNSIFDVNSFKKNQFDLIFVAMLIEHVPDINKFLSDIYNILKPGGKLVTICHNERHFLSKILKNKHPIINDEHNYVFSPNTLKQIYSKNKFKNIQINNLKNYYPIDYWIFMPPLPKFLIKLINIFLNKKFHKKIMGIKIGWCPGGPIVQCNKSDNGIDALEKFKEVIFEEKIINLRCKPYMPDTPENQKIFSIISKSNYSFTSPKSNILKIVSDEEFLKKVKKKHRYYIKSSHESIPRAWSKICN